MINRRHVLSGLGGLAIAPMFLRSMAAEAASGNSTIIVAILMAGGNDGLNTVIPIPQYGSYVKLRTPAPPPKPALALAYTLEALAPQAFNSNPAVPVGSATQFAFAPGMGPMRSLYATGHLAVIAGVALPSAEMNALSHANAQIDWLTGQINLASVPQGWLGLTLAGQSAGVLGPTVSMSGSSVVLSTGTAQATVISSPMDNFGIRYSVTDNLTQLKSAYSQILALPTASANAAFDQSVLMAAINDIATVQAIAKAVPATNYPTPTSLDTQLRDIARLIIGGAGVRAYFAEQGSYDTHSSQAETQPTLLTDLSTSLNTFYTYLQAAGASSNVVVMTMSDFGRRPAANLNFGTDHGGASISFVLGDPIKGGVYGTYPSLLHFDPNNNLKLTVDFRNVLSDLIVAMGGNAATILGETWPALGFI